MSGDTQLEATASFGEFINIVANGAYELELYLEEKDLQGKSVGVDTSMIDGVSGISKKWNPYWRTCGVCHLHFQPEYIVHMEHAKADFKVKVVLRELPQIVRMSST